MRDESDHERRRECSSQPCTHEQDAVSPSAFLNRKPLGETSRRVGEGSRLAGAKQKPEGGKRKEMPREAGRHRERRPPKHEAPQNLSPTRRVAEPSAWNFKDRVRQRECAEHPAHLYGVEME